MEPITGIRKRLLEGLAGGGVRAYHGEAEHGDEHDHEHNCQCRDRWVVVCTDNMRS